MLSRVKISSGGSFNSFRGVTGLAQEQFLVEHREFLTGERRIDRLPNLRAEVAVFLLTRVTAAP